MIKFNMWGKTEQVQTAGANLIPQIFLEKKIINGITFEPVSRNEIKVYGTATKDSVMPYNYFIIKPGTYTLSINQKVIKSKFRVCFMNKMGRPKLDILNLQSSSTGVFDMEEQFTVLLRVYQGVEINMNICFMFNEGGSALPYEPYSGGFPSPSPDWEQPIEVTDKPVTVTIKGGTEQQSITLVPPRPLTKWDKLEKVDGVWQWVYQSKACMLSDIATEWAYYQNDGIKQFYFSCKDCFCEKNKNNIYADRFKSWTVDERQNNYGTVYLSNEAICFNVDKFSTLENWEDWVSANPVELLYKTKETEYIPLQQSEQEKLNALTMYTPTTEITNNGRCTMELTYTVDTKSYVDTKIAEISTAIVQKGI